MLFRDGHRNLRRFIDSYYTTTIVTRATTTRQTNTDSEQCQVTKKTTSPRGNDLPIPRPELGE